MTYFLPLLLLFCFSSSLYANVTSYEWVLEQYGNNQTSEIEARAAGQIEGDDYIAIIARRTSATSNDGPVILVFKNTQNRLAIVAKIDLQGDHAIGYGVTIENNSIYIEHWVGHHGWHGKRYQFKKIKNKFKMVGAERQFQKLGCYAGDESPSCSEREVWSGASFNFLTSSAICWQQTINQRDIRKSKDALPRFGKWVQPKNGVRYQMTFRPVYLPLLDGLDFLEFSLPKACYIDHKNKPQLEP